MREKLFGCPIPGGVIAYHWARRLLPYSNIAGMDFKSIIQNYHSSKIL